MKKTTEARPESSSEQPLKTLVVDDNPIAQLVIKKILNKMGHHADVVHNGKEALERIEHTSYDIVFMDMQMPVLNGVETTKRLKVMRNAPYVVAISSNAATEDQMYYKSIGVDHFLGKPVTPETIQDILSSCNPECIENKPMATSYPELQTLLKYLGNDTKLAKIVIERFLNKAHSHIATLEIFLKKRDPESIKYYTHKLRGAIAYYGHQSLVADLEAIELESDAERLNRTKNMLPSIESKLTTLIKTLEKIQREL